MVYDETFSKNKCKCIEGYFYDDNTKICEKCTKLDFGCLKCKASVKDNNIYYMNCEICDKNYVKDKNGFCHYCNYYCSECTLDENKNI